MKYILSLLSIVSFLLTASAQSPERMSYQAVIRNTDNQLVTNQSVSVQINILQGSANGPVVYQEVHSVSTNENGLLTLSIGNGLDNVGDFSAIDWSAGPYFLETGVDPTGAANYVISSVSQLLSVPYALHAKTAENLSSSGPIEVAGNIEADGDFTYAQPQTRYYAVDGGSFSKYNGADDFTIRRFFSNYPTYTTLSGGTPGTPGRIYAPVQLPDGAIVTNITARMRDGDDGSVTAKVDFVVVSSVSGAVLASCITEDEGGIQEVSTDTEDLEIQNQFNTYGLMFTGNRDGDNTGSSLYWIRITYTVDKAD